MYCNDKMKNKNKRFDNILGFTLIEVIVTILVAAIMGTMLVNFMGNRISGSALLLNNVKKTYDLSAVMENIVADYNQKIVDQNDDTPLETLKTSIGAAGSTFNNSYGSYKVLENGYISFSCSDKNCSSSTPSASTTNTLKVKIADVGDSQAVTALFAQ